MTISRHFFRDADSEVYNQASAPTRPLYRDLTQTSAGKIQQRHLNENVTEYIYNTREYVSVKHLRLST